MTFQEMFDEAKSAGLSFDQMRQNCRSQCCDYLRYVYFADKKARRSAYLKSGVDWRQAARRCLMLLRWLDQREATQ